MWLSEVLEIAEFFKQKISTVNRSQNIFSKYKCYRSAYLIYIKIHEYVKHSRFEISFQRVKPDYKGVPLKMHFDKRSLILQLVAI